MSILYKICSAALWREAERDGVFRGSADDRRDGFIHFSTAGQDGLVLIADDAERLGPALKWEPSRGGALFPHLYGEFAVSAAASVAPLPRGADGRHIFPPLEA
jgi:uncharacterized protein (DUF952 family)